MKTIYAADLFCGAGGTSTGIYNAARDLGYQLQLLAINHWQVAIDTHTENHPEATHKCENLDNVDPRKVVPGGYLNLLVASPECTHHSRARGGRPKSDQSRASAWHILRWAEALYIENILIENVPEFVTWGPLDKDLQPVERLKGKTFLAFIEGLKSLGYNVDWRVINAADYGDPTTRKRLFIMARRDKPVIWPIASFSKAGGTDMLRTTQKWRPAREIIDWDIKGESIFTRKKPLAPNTMKRILAGLNKYSGLPFVLGQQSCASPRTVEEPIPTIAAAGAISLIEPFLVQLNGTEKSHLNGSTAKSIHDPVPTLTGSNHVGVAEPFIVMLNSTKEKVIPSTAKSLDAPLPALATRNHVALVEPFIITCGGPEGQGRNARSIEEPIGTVLSDDHHALVEPYLVRYNGTGDAVSIDEPVPTITARDRFGLVMPTAEGPMVVDIRFRMLQPHELARAMSFPAEYKFTGNREERVKQIGNAVPVRTAAALCESLLQ